MSAGVGVIRKEKGHPSGALGHTYQPDPCQEPPGGPSLLPSPGKGCRCWGLPDQVRSQLLDSCWVIAGSPLSFSEPPFPASSIRMSAVSSPNCGEEGDHAVITGFCPRRCDHLCVQSFVPGAILHPESGHRPWPLWVPGSVSLSHHSAAAQSLASLCSALPLPPCL